MIDQITVFKHQEAEIESRISQLTHLNLDISTLEAVKQLKGLDHTFMSIIFLFSTIIVDSL